MHVVAQGMENHSLICLRKGWLDRKQELITVIQEETKRTEGKEEAGYRSPTSSVLRALQKINKSKRLEGEAVMLGPPFSQSAGPGDYKFWKKDDGPTVVVCGNLWESEQEQWSKKMGRSKDWAVRCRLRKNDEEQRPFEWKRNILKLQQASEGQSRRENG